MKSRMVSMYLLFFYMLIKLVMSSELAISGKELSRSYLLMTMNLISIFKSSNIWTKKELSYLYVFLKKGMLSEYRFLNTILIIALCIFFRRKNAQPSKWVSNTNQAKFCVLWQPPNPRTQGYIQTLHT